TLSLIEEQREASAKANTGVNRGTSIHPLSIFLSSATSPKNRMPCNALQSPLRIRRLFTALATGKAGFSRPPGTQFFDLTLKAVPLFRRHRPVGIGANTHF